MAFLCDYIRNPYVESLKSDVRYAICDAAILLNTNAGSHMPYLTSHIADLYMVRF